jgi:hypothetical protein
MRRVFNIGAFCLDSDPGAWTYFHRKDNSELKTITGGVILFLFDTLEDLFREKGMNRFEGLEAGQLSSLWAEVSRPEAKAGEAADAHFIVPLRGLSSDQVRDVLTDLCDAARKASGFKDWQVGFDARQKQRSAAEVLGQTTTPQAGPAATNPKPAGPPHDNPAPTNPGGTGSHPQHDHLLVQLGKILGLGGTGIGTFFLLLEKLFAQKIFPMLEPRQVSQIVLLIYAISALALIGYIAMATARRYIPGMALVFAALMAWWSTTLMDSSSRAEYAVRVYVAGPGQASVTEAHVWSDLGGITKKGVDNWEIDIPRETNRGTQHGKAYAEVVGEGLYGTAELALDAGMPPPVHVTMQKVGELPVRGIVVGPDRYAVANAIVSVVGYGEEAKPTNGSGGFELPSHAQKGEKISLHAEKPPFEPADLPEYEVGSEPAKLVLGKQGTPRTPTPRPAPPAKTGDEVVDRVAANIASLKRLPRPALETQWAEVLAPLFRRAAFEDIRHEDWGYFLFPLYLSRKLLEDHVGEFRNPDARQNIGNAMQKMLGLQGELAALFGPNFRLDEYMDKYGKTKREFVDHLPSIITNPSRDFFNQRNAEVSAIRTDLKNAGLPLS